MCYSAPVSLAAFIIGAIFSYLLYLENDISYKVIGIFFGYIILIQLIEFLLWTHQKCDIYNKTISVIGMLINYLQPVVLAIILLKFLQHSKTNKKIIMTLTGIYFIAMLLYTSQYYFKINKCSLKEGNPYLLWNWGQLKYSSIMAVLYLITLFTLIYIGIPNKIASISLIFIAAITLFISFIFYPRPFVGAIWCFFGAFIPMLIYLYKFFK
jgi:hypothetical protein